ncbi:PHO85 cyclin-7 [Golovinomyces cichoracearum]|uniref:PHO85 cyclin-7 n=1 Tax=Golovinomyces cichoracearum TaxID=62708 RepID=A0A420JB17_9PEZI|nr:PHO85 cyclin-7 [Golovinomyces cichoracearum]
MAAIISDFISDPAHFQHSHTMITGTIKQLSPAETQYLQISNLREVPPSPQSPSNPVHIESQSPTNRRRTSDQNDSDNTNDEHESEVTEVVSPTSASKSLGKWQKFMSQENISRSSSSYAQSPQITPSDIKTRNTSCFSLNSTHVTLPRSSVSSDDVKGYCGNKVKVRNLAHIRSFVLDDLSHFRRQPGQRLRDRNDTPTYEISGMPITDVIEMVAGLLTKIVTTNDRQITSRNRSPQPSDNTESMKINQSSVAAFHGKNVPNITILSYLSRIHKYCPTTYEVFLSLLVYFDRMTERVNKALVQTSEKNFKASSDSLESSESSMLAKTPPLSPSRRNDGECNLKTPPNTVDGPSKNSRQEASASRLFVIDSYNIHRLVIAGVTCASKFFSDVFYTNSRYAKVGGLPLTELNHLELQFLLINDFRLFVPVEELEVYGTMLLEFYAREMLSQERGPTSTETTSSKNTEAVSS